MSRDEKTNELITTRNVEFTCKKERKTWLWKISWICKLSSALKPVVVFQRTLYATLRFFVFVVISD